MKLTNAELRSLPIGRKVSDEVGLYYQPTDETKVGQIDNEKCFDAVNLLQNEIS